MSTVIGPGSGEAVANLLDQLRAGEVQQIIVAALVAAEAEIAAIGAAVELLGLDQSAVGAVLGQDALGRLGAEGLGRAHAAAFARTPSKWQMA